MDDDGSRSLGLAEFEKACREFKIGISDENIPELFSKFDTNRDGTLNIDEFLMAIRGEMNEKRLGLVRKAFTLLDKDGSGALEVRDITGSFKTDKHPDVLEGKRTPEQVLVEFLQTFEAHHNMSKGESSDGKVTLDEFVEYYRNISSSIDNDDYFALMMNNSWNLRGDASPYKKFEKGWTNNDVAETKKSQTSAFRSEDLRHPQSRIQRTGQTSNQNPLADNTTKFYKPVESADRR